LTPTHVVFKVPFLLSFHVDWFFMLLLSSSHQSSITPHLLCASSRTRMLKALDWSSIFWRSLIFHCFK
jgi:hypothetical protein